MTTKMISTAGRLKIAVTCDKEAGSQCLDLPGEAGAERSPAGPHLQARSQCGGQIDQFGAARGGKLGRHDDAEVVQERYDVARPADGDGDGADSVFEDQIPADDPGE